MISANKLTALGQKILDIAALKNLSELHLESCKNFARNSKFCACTEEISVSKPKLIRPFFTSKNTNQRILFGEIYVTFKVEKLGFEHFELFEIHTQEDFVGHLVYAQFDHIYVGCAEKDFGDPWIVRRNVMKFLCKKENSFCKLSVPQSSKNEGDGQRYVPVFTPSSGHAAIGSPQWHVMSFFEFTRQELL